MRLSYKFWHSNKARLVHEPKHNLLVASTVQVTSVSYEEIHATRFLTYSITAHAWGKSEEHYKTDHLLAEYTETTQQLKWRGSFIILVSNFNTFRRLIWFYIPTLRDLQLSRITSSMEMTYSRSFSGMVNIEILSYRHEYGQAMRKKNWSPTRGSPNTPSNS